MNRITRISIMIITAFVVLGSFIPSGSVTEPGLTDVSTPTTEPVSHTTRAGCDLPGAVTEGEIANMTLIWENFTLHKGNVWMVRWSPNGTYLVSVGFDGRIVLWNGTSGEPMWSTVGHNDFIRSVTWSPSSTLIATGSDNGIIRIWNATSGDLVTRLSDASLLPAQKAHDGQIVALDWSVSGNTLVSVSGEDSEPTNNGDNTVKLWSFPSGNLSRNLTTFTHQAMDAQFSPVKDNLLAVAGDTEIRLYDVNSMEIKNLFKMNDTVHCVSWAPNGSRIASGTRNFYVHLFNVNTGKKMGGYYDPEFKRREIAWAPNGEYLAEAGSGEMIKIRAVKNGTIIKTLLGPSAVTAPGGDGSRAVEPSSGTRCSGNYLPSLSWSDCGRYIATGTAGTNSVVVYGDRKFDRVAPRLIGFSPTGTNVPRESVISVRFSEPISLQSFETAFSLTDLFRKWTAADGSLIRLSHGREFIFSPAERLPANATIIVNIDYTLTDAAGNKLTGNNHWGFHTISNYAPILSNGYVRPSSGDEDTDFYFYTRYLDQDGDVPLEIHVVIDTIPHEMSHMNGSNSNGYYRLRTKLDVGVHSYYFSASDGELDAVSSVGPETSLQITVEEAEEESSLILFTADIVGGTIILIMILVWFKIVLAKTKKSEDKK